MRARPSSWPKIIGGAVAVFALGCTLLSIGECQRRELFTHPPALIDIRSWIVAAASILLFALSYPIYRGRDWARLTLLGVSLLVAAGIVLGGVSFFRHESHVIIDGSFTVEQVAGFRREARIGALFDLGFILALLTVPSFFICLLLHPEVKQAFTPRSLAPMTPTSNQPMELTASPRTTSFSVATFRVS